VVRQMGAGCGLHLSHGINNENAWDSLHDYLLLGRSMVLLAEHEPLPPGMDRIGSIR
jgi:hypothetical protein